MQIMFIILHHESNWLSYGNLVAASRRARRPGWYLAEGDDHVFVKDLRQQVTGMTQRRKVIYEITGLGNSTIV